MIGLIPIAFRNFVRNLRRYRVLLIAFVLVVAALVTLLGVVSGMQFTVRAKASRFFAGDIVLLGVTGPGESRIEHSADLLELIDGIGSDTRAVSLRSTFYDQNNSLLFHAGFSTRQRRLLGVEWEREAPVFAGFDFVSGGVPESGDTNAVVISTAAAAAIEATVGDRIIVSGLTMAGSQNTAELIVRGIYRESSFFGFATYLHRETLNVLRNRPVDTVNEIGIYLENASRDEARVARAVTQALSTRFPTFPVATDRDQFATVTSLRRTERHYGVVTLAAQLAEINDLLFAMTAIAGVIIIMFLAITMIGVANTYTMITFERTREIGTLRALGMQARDAVFVFVAEAVILSLVGLAAGMVVGVGILSIVSSQVSFAAGGVTDLFLHGGRLIWQLPAGGLAAIAALTVGAGTLGALRASVRAGRTSPVDALRAS